MKEDVQCWSMTEKKRAQEWRAILHLSDWKPGGFSPKGPGLPLPLGSPCTAKPGLLLKVFKKGMEPAPLRGHISCLPIRWGLPVKGEQLANGRVLYHGRRQVLVFRKENWDGHHGEAFPVICRAAGSPPGLLSGKA